MSEPAKQLQLEVDRLAQEGRVVQAAEALVGFILPRSGAWKYLSMPLVWSAARFMSLGASRELSDLVITVEAEDKHNFKERLGEISAPTLVIAGMDDPFYTESLFRETAGGIPNARLILYPKMRHPAGGKQFARDVLEFLNV